jgi:hypothetical protein|tara:strand:- start:47 stop:811 length:765 start_codon:yes stop_codon:yes gene_type:complete
MEKKKNKKPVEVKAPKWELKDRIYRLLSKRKPVVRILKARNIYYFDEEKGYEREMKYCENQKTVFVEDMMGPQRLGQIVFRDGTLVVPKNKTTLQKLLSIYHPDLNKLYFEVDNEKQAESELDMFEVEMDALQAAMSMEVEQAEAVLRTELGNKVSEMKSKELKRDLYIFAKQNPQLFLELANDDNLEVRNKGIKAVEANIITLSEDQRTFKWTSTGRKLIEVPFDENPYSALAAWFKTDDGIDVYKSVEKQLK